MVQTFEQAQIVPNLMGVTLCFWLTTDSLSQKLTKFTNSGSPPEIRKNKQMVKDKTSYFPLELKSDAKLSLPVANFLNRFSYMGLFLASLTGNVLKFYIQSYIQKSVIFLRVVFDPKNNVLCLLTVSTRISPRL